MSRRGMRRETGQVGCDCASTVRIAVGAKLGVHYSMREPIPDRMAELLKLLDQPIENGQEADEVAQQCLPANPPEPAKVAQD
jgi:hypothetical protein